MQTLRLMLVVTGAALALPLVVTAQPTDELRDMSPQERRDYVESLSPEERHALAEQRRAEWQSMSEEQRQAARAQRRSHWESMSDEERAAMRARQQAHRAENRAAMREHWESMSPEQREAARQQREERVKERPDVELEEDAIWPASTSAIAAKGCTRNAMTGAAALSRK